MVDTNLQLERAYMQNRELSWMSFNERVLEESMAETTPLLERLKFISIFISNFDEFFMIRVGSLTDLSLMEGNNIDNKTGMSPKEQLNMINKRAVTLYQYCNSAYHVVENKLREYGICNLEMNELSQAEKKYIDKFYKHDILPILSPQVIDSRHPFPHLINKTLYIMCSFLNKNKMFGLVPVSTSLPKFVLLPGNQMRYVLTEKIILGKIADIFSMHKVEEAAVIAVTRNADIGPDDEIYEENDNYNYKDLMKKMLKKRSRLAPVRLEVQGKLNKELDIFLQEKLDIEEGQVFESQFPLVMNYVFELLDVINEHLKKQLSYPEYEVSLPFKFTRDESITAQCKKKDMLLFYPYNSMDPFLRLLKESADDANVISIKITIYRVAKTSRIIDSLCSAAENGKEVTVLIELKARFDEKNNIEWAEKLEQSGCNVIYGFEEFKVHSKICLITRREKNEIVYITQIGTGNYNEKTSKIYSDFCLITANQDIGNDANNFFKNMLISNLNGSYVYLMVAPYSFKNYLVALMDEEISKANNGQRGRIIIKSNSLTDKEIINKLVSASKAGVEVILIIRGICCILPEIAGVTENIKVISIVGRFLEHARVYCFGTESNMNIYIASADMMTRNTSRRVEIGCPILDQQIKETIYKILEIMISDNVQGRLLCSDGSYRRIDGELETSRDSQNYFTYNLNLLFESTSKNASADRFTLKKANKKYGQELKKIFGNIFKLNR